MKSFKPAFGLRNRHFQTLYSSFFRKKINHEFEIEVFELDDGDFIECFWCESRPKADEPIVILFHGLEGSYKSSYIQGIMKALKNAGLSSVLMHFRGCSGKINRKARAYHSGDTIDAKKWIKYLHVKYPNNTLHAIGYSLGGNMLLKLLGEWKDKSLLSSAISISAPMQLNISANTMKKGFARVYQQYLLKHLKKSLCEKYSYHPMEKLINLEKNEIKKIKTLWDFDDAYTSKIHGFGTAKKYYELSSAKQYLKDIKTKTLIIHALDDPFMTKDILPKKGELSPSIKLEIHQHGGHVGFVGGTIFKPIYWTEKRVIEFLL